VSDLRLFTYRLPLCEPLRLANVTLEHREGLLLVQTVGTESIWAEAAPLPGFSRESLADVIAAAAKQRWDQYPCLSLAVQGLAAGNLQSDADLPICGLLLGDLRAVRQQIPPVATGPHRAIKLKVGRRNQLTAEIALVRELRNALRPDQKLRLDANRQWSFAEATQFAQAIAGLDLEFIEEPTACPADFERLWQNHGLPYALDETLREPDFSWALFPHVAAVIIKPSLGGWPPPGWSMRRTDVPVVFSASFESGVGVWQIARLALQFASAVPAGLDTYRWLATDVLCPRLSFHAGQVRVPAQVSVDWTRLREVTP